MNYVDVEIFHKNMLKGKTTINIRVLAFKMQKNKLLKS